MPTSLRTLLTAVLDYAGLFPPAKLPLETAFHNYLRYRRSPYSWLLGKFICPAPQLPALAKLISASGEVDPPLSFSILGRGGNDGATFFANLHEDRAVIDDFRRAQPKADVSAFEVRLPSDSTIDAAFLERLVRSGGFQPPITVSLEAAFHGDWRSSLHELIAAIQTANAALGLPQLGFKLRCGGMEAAAFPTVEQVAFVLTACRDVCVPVKFTAGLHHPFRHRDASLDVLAHGFLNVFTAGALAFILRLDQNEVCKILADEDADHFHFDNDALDRQELLVTNDQIAIARRGFVTSFGSCSFDEPVEDLQRLMSDDHDVHL